MQLKNTEKFTYSLSVLLWFILGVGYFCLYYAGLNLQITFLTLAFTLSLLTSFFLLFIASGSKVLRVVVTSLYLTMHLYGLTNFAFYSVFKTFLTISSRQISNLNTPFLRLLTNFIGLVPVYLYLGVALLLALTIHIFLVRPDNFLTHYSLQRAINFIRTKKTYSIKRLAIVAILLSILNLSSVFLVKNYRAIFSDSFSREDYLANLGIYGYFLLKVTAKEDGATTTKAIAEKQKTDLQILHDRLNSLKEISGTDGQDIPNLPPRDIKQPHIIIYQMESVDNWAVKQNPSPMPFLRRLMENKLSAKHFFSNSCMTINAEFSTLCSFYPDSYGPVSDLYAHNNYNCLPKILRDGLGYETNIYHANSSEFWSRNSLAPRWGFTNQYFTPNLKERESDNLVLHRVVEKIKSSQSPTFNMVIGFTSHAPHDQHYADLNKEQNNLTIIPYQSEIDKKILDSIEIKENTARWYMGYLTAIDDSLKSLFLELRAQNLLQNTIVVAYGDHRYYNFKSDDPVADFYNYNEVPMVIFAPGLQPLQRDIASQADIAPTLLRLVTGKNGMNPENFLGQDLLSTDYSNFAINKCLGEALLVSKKNIIKSDLLMDSYQNIFHGHTTGSEPVAAQVILHEIAALSDRLLKKDQLSVAGKNDFGKPLDQATQTTSTDKFTDIDGDGLSDLRERILGSDPENPDTDGDKIPDGEEVARGSSILLSDNPLASSTNPIQNTSTIK